MADPDAAEDVEATEPPKVEKETGIVQHGDFPLNHRLRAEAIVAAGIDEDPDGLISGELIADTKARLARDAEAARIAEEERLAAFPPVNASMKVEALEAIAAKEGVDLTSASNNDDRVRLIEEHRQPVNLNPSPPTPTPPPPPPAGAGAGAAESQKGE